VKFPQFWHKDDGDKIEISTVLGLLFSASVFNMCLGSNLEKIKPNDTLPGETVAGLTTDVDDEFESDWLKLLRRSSFSRVRNPSILMIFLQPTNQGKPLKITGFTLPSHVTMKRQTTHTYKKWQIKKLVRKKQL
jgi:hypothetical protein